MKQLPLFVYGTLLSDQPAFPLFAAASVHFLPAEMKDLCLYNVGRYPIAAAGTGSVTGEVHWLHEAGYDALLARLDQYEGDEYRRVQREAVILGAHGVEQSVAVWIYLGDPTYAAQFDLISNGDWRKRASDVNN